MTTRWEVEAAICTSNIEPMGRLILLTLLCRTVSKTAEIPPAHAPSYTDLEATTGISRSALVEWMKALTDGGWVKRVHFEEESRDGFQLLIGDPNAQRAPRARTKRAASGARIPAPRAEMNADASYRLAAYPTERAVPPGGMERIAERYGIVSPGGTVNGSHLLLENSPTESSTTTTLNPPLFGGDVAADPKPSASKPRKAAKDEPYREDVDRICTYLAEWIVKNGSKRPTITKEWRVEARRLIDLDKRPLDEIQRVIRWSQRDNFWRKNILSMPTFREKYDRLRLGASDDPNNQGRRNGGLGSGVHVPYLDPEDQSVYDRPL